MTRRFSLMDRWRLFKVNHLVGNWWIDVWKLNRKHGDWETNDG